MKTSVMLAMALLAAPAFALTETNYLTAFNQFKINHQRMYASVEEEALRFAIFKANFDKVAMHNAKGLSWTMGLNEYADLTSQEFAIGRIGGYKPRKLRRSVKPSPQSVDLPTEVDWSKKGAVTPIKNQGQCGSCWAFSTTGSTEGITFIKTGKLLSLSEQQLVDCSGAEGNQGCNGGLMDYAFQYIMDNKGICSESAYPYQGVDGTCQSTSCTNVATITGFTDVTPDNDIALATAVAQQPVSIAVEADQDSFQFYTSGVMTAACGTQLDHGVLAVGYGTEGGKEYYKVKNSWGASWGEAGYILLARGESYNGGAGQCGLYSDPSYPTKN